MAGGMRVQGINLTWLVGGLSLSCHHPRDFLNGIILQGWGMIKEMITLSYATKTHGRPRFEPGDLQVIFEALSN